MAGSKSARLEGAVPRRKAAANASATLFVLFFKTLNWVSEHLCTVSYCSNVYGHLLSHSHLSNKISTKWVVFKLVTGSFPAPWISRLDLSETLNQVRASSAMNLWGLSFMPNSSSMYSATKEPLSWSPRRFRRARFLRSVYGLPPDLCQTLLDTRPWQGHANQCHRLSIIISDEKLKCLAEESIDCIVRHSEKFLWLYNNI